MPNIRLNTSLFFLLLTSIAPVLWAKSEVTPAISTYHLYGTNISGPEMQDVLNIKQEAMNADYNRCMSQPRGTYYDFYCNKYSFTGNVYPRTNWDLVNDETTWWMVEMDGVTEKYNWYRGKSTQEIPPMNLGVTVTWHCPNAAGELGGVTHSSGPRNNKQVWCEKVEPQSCPVGR